MVGFFLMTNTDIQAAITDHERRMHTKGRFKPPTLAEVAKEFPDIDAEKFINFYGSKGWMVGKNKMKDWRCAARNARSWNTQPTEEKKCVKLNCYKRGPATYGPDDTGQMHFKCKNHGGK